MTSCERSLRIGVYAIAFAFAALAAFPARVLAQPVMHPIPGPVVCASLMQQYETALKHRDYAETQKLGAELIKYKCYTPRPPLPIAKACSAGIKNIATFLQTCPPADPAYTTIVQDFPLSFDGTQIPKNTLSQDLNTVCTNIANPSAPAPTLEQQAEHTVMQVLRTMYYMDNQGARGCPYPWTGGNSLYGWEKSMIGGIDIRNDGAYSDCCEYVGGKYLFGLNEPAASQYPVDYTWMGIANQMALYVHEARHSPKNLPPPNTQAAFAHSTCCPGQGNSVTASCDNTYDESSLAPYGTQYWLFRGWLNGTVNVGYACMAPSDAQATSQLFQGAANGYLNRFCTDPPSNVSMPAAPGGPCP